MFNMFYIIILGTWEGGNSKNRENEKGFQKAKKSRLSLHNLPASHRRTAKALVFVVWGGGGKRHKRTIWRKFVLLKTSSIQPFSKRSIIVILIAYLLMSNRGFIFTAFITTTTTFLQFFKLFQGLF